MTEKKRGRPRKIQEESPEEGCHIVLTIGGETYESTGATAEEALGNLKLPIKIMNKGIIRMDVGEKSTGELLFMPIHMRRFLFPISRVFSAKRLEYLLR